MLLRLQQYFIKIRPVTVDGALYVFIALFGAMITTFNSDDAYKYMNPHFKYWAQSIAGWGLAIVSALKMFRSTSYSEHLDEKADNKTLSSTKTVAVAGDVKTEKTETETKKE